MAVDGIAGVQARIMEIEQIIASKTGSTANAPASSTEQSSEFASLLSDALGTSTSDSSAASALGNSATGAAPTSGGLDPSSILSQLSQVNGMTNAATSSPQGVAEKFLDTALTQAGKPYVWGASASPTDPNPKAFDCSELTKWAAARNGIQIPDVARIQYLFLKQHGTTMTVDQALHTPGALLFRFSNEPRNANDNPSEGHVAISVGDGVHTIEARGHAYGTNVFDNAAGRGFNFAGMIPGMS